MIRVMLVEDSAMVRGLIARGLKGAPDIEIVATAFNGKMAIDSLKHYQADVILLDIEMPEMDGLTALPKLLELAPDARVIMVSTLTERNAAISLKALELGAADYIPKPQASGNAEDFYRELTGKIRALAGGRASAAPARAPAPAPAVREAAALPSAPVEAIAIGSSTGGPQALIQLFGQLRPRFPRVPLFITQHMPPAFTAILAQQLSKHGGVDCAEAAEGMEALPGRAYLAPGDYHMEAVRRGHAVTLHIHRRPPVNFCRPSVDVMLASLVKIYGSGLLTAILTGMGNDGLKGAKEAARRGGAVIAQDQDSSAVWGMPRAVAEAGICKAVLPLGAIAEYIANAAGV